MTTEEARKELLRCAELCTITPLSKACKIGAKALEQTTHNCNNCKYHDIDPMRDPCIQCSRMRKDKWEPAIIDDKS